MIRGQRVIKPFPGHAALLSEISVTYLGHIKLLSEISNPPRRY